MSTRTCRICLQKKGQLSLLEKWETKLPAEPITFIDAYNNCTHLLANANDSLPQFICLSCGKDLQCFYEFLQRAKVSDAKLRELTAYMRRTRAKSKALEQRNTLLEPVTTDALLLEKSTEALRDPLEETDEEIEPETEQVQYWTEAGEGVLPASSYSDYDEEDNKPLKHLFNKVNETEVNTERNLEINLNTVLSQQHFTVEKEEPEGGEYNLSEDVPDIILTAEAQIFPQGRHKCKTCGKLYFTMTGLKAHLDMHQPKIVSHTTKRKRVRGPNKKKRNVDITLAETTTETSMDAEQKVDSRTARFEVEAVNKKERQPRKPKPPKPKKMFPCQVCGKHMISASKLRYHMVMHTGEKDYLCTMCPKAYSTIYALKHHIKTHTGDRPYECRFCGDRFLRPTTLKSHIRRHTGERPYGCDICGKRFIQHSSMTTHIKLNHMAKTIPCSHCDKKYARQTDLNTHLLSHTGDKPFSCKLCPSRFIRQANLNKHMNQHHSGERERCSESKTSKSTRKTHTKANTSFNNVQQQFPFANYVPSEEGPSLVPRTTTHLAASSNPTLRVDSCSMKTLPTPILRSLAQQANAMFPAIYATETFHTDAPQQHILGKLQHTKNIETKDKTVPGQQLLFAAPTPSMAQAIEEDLQRWNWPHSS